MPCSYRIDQKNGLVITTGEGVITTAEMRGHDLALFADPDFDIKYNQLIDFRQATEVITTGADIRRLATSALWGEGSRRAAVMPKDSMYGLWRMYGAFNKSNGSYWHVFRTVVSALVWLEEMEGESDAQVTHALELCG